MAIQGHTHITPALSLEVSWARPGFCEVQAVGTVRACTVAMEGDIWRLGSMKMKRNRTVSVGNWFGDSDDFSLDLLVLKKPQNKTFKDEEGSRTVSRSKKDKEDESGKTPLGLTIKWPW